MAAFDNVLTSLTPAEKSFANGIAQSQLLPAVRASTSKPKLFCISLVGCLLKYCVSAARHQGGACSASFIEPKFRDVSSRHLL